MMANTLVDDRGRLSGSRLTVYNLLPYLLDPAVTEAYICQVYELQPEQVAAARAFALNHPDTVLARHLAIEERLAAGNPPEVIERAKQVHATFVEFRAWLVQRQKTEAKCLSETAEVTAQEPTFREWLAERELHHKSGA